MVELFLKFLFLFLIFIMVNEENLSLLIKRQSF